MAVKKWDISRIRGRSLMFPTLEYLGQKGGQVYCRQPCRFGTLDLPKNGRVGCMIDLSDTRISCESSTKISNGQCFECTGNSTGAPKIGFLLEICGFFLITMVLFSGIKSNNSPILRLLLAKIYLPATLLLFVFIFAYISHFPHVLC